MRCKSNIIIGHIALLWLFTYTLVTAVPTPNPTNCGKGKGKGTGTYSPGSYGKGKGKGTYSPGPHGKGKGKGNSSKSPAPYGKGKGKGNLSKSPKCSSNDDDGSQTISQFCDDDECRGRNQCNVPSDASHVEISFGVVGDDTDVDQTALNAMLCELTQSRRKLAAVGAQIKVLSVYVSSVIREKKGCKFNCLYNIEGVAFYNFNGSPVTSAELEKAIKKFIKNKLGNGLSFDKDRGVTLKPERTKISVSGRIGVSVYWAPPFLVVLVVGSVMFFINNKKKKNTRYREIFTASMDLQANNFSDSKQSPKLLQTSILSRPFFQMTSHKKNMDGLSYDNLDDSFVVSPKKSFGMFPVRMTHDQYDESEFDESDSSILTSFATVRRRTPTKEQEEEHQSYSSNHHSTKQDIKPMLYFYNSNFNSYIPKDDRSLNDSMNERSPELRRRSPTKEGENNEKLQSHHHHCDTSSFDESEITNTYNQTYRSDINDYVNRKSLPNEWDLKFNREIIFEDTVYL